VTDGELKARLLACRQWRGRLRVVRAESWMVCEEARTANVIDLARAVTQLTILVGEMVNELEREATETLASHDVRVSRFMSEGAALSEARAYLHGDRR